MWIRRVGASHGLETRDSEPSWSVRGLLKFISGRVKTRNPHTYLDGIGPFMYLGLWAARASHSTATLSSGGTCGLYGLRLMHRLNIFLSRSGPRAGRAPFLSVQFPNPNLTTIQCHVIESMCVVCCVWPQVVP